MPNWCTQRLKIEMLGERNTSREVEILQSLLNDEGDFDFNKIIPMPKELNDTESSSRNILALQYYVNTMLRRTPTEEPDPEFRSKVEIVKVILFRTDPLVMNHQQFSDLMANIGDSSLPEYFVLGEKCFNNLIKYGHMNWYTWRNANWGVKWNAANTTIVGDNSTHTAMFDTAWLPARPVIDELAEQYPECRIILDFAEEQVSEFAGHYEWENGEIVMEELYDSGSIECYEMAFELGVADRDNYELVGDTYRYKG